MSKPPEGFAALGKSRPEKSKALSPDGVVYAVHSVKNKPEADLAFWSDALRTRMSQAGYRVLGDTTVPLAGGEGLLLRLAAPLGQQDYLYYVGLALRDKKIRIFEAAGEAARFKAHEAALLNAMAGP